MQRIAFQSVAFLPISAVIIIIFFIPAGSRDPGVKSKVKNRLVELLLLFIIFIIN